MEGRVETHKLIFMAPQSRIDEIRPRVQQQLSGRASLTTAIKGMLEVRGGGKGSHGGVGGRGSVCTGRGREEEGKGKEGGGATYVG